MTFNIIVQLKSSAISYLLHTVTCSKCVWARALIALFSAIEADRRIIHFLALLPRNLCTNEFHFFKRYISCVIICMRQLCFTYINICNFYTICLGLHNIHNIFITFFFMSHSFLCFADKC